MKDRLSSPRLETCPPPRPRFCAATDQSGLSVISIRHPTLVSTLRYPPADSAVDPHQVLAPPAALQHARCEAVSRDKITLILILIKSPSSSSSSPSSSSSDKITLIPILITIVVSKRSLPGAFPSSPHPSPPLLSSPSSCLCARSGLDTRHI
jgi:hypothetical protein